MPIHNLRMFLPIYYVYLLELNFFLLIVALIFNFKYIKDILAGIERKALIFLISISVFGVFTTSLIAPRIHRIFFDEDIYNGIGQCIAHHKRAVMCNEGYYENNELKVVAEEYNKQPQGYPYLISVVFRIFGTNELFIFILNNLIYGLMAFVVFLIVYLLFNDTFAGLAASLAYILIPINLQWFNTCAVEPSTTFFSSMAILAALIYLKNKRPINLFLLTATVAFSFNFRPESFLIVLTIGLLFLLKDIRVLKRKELYIFGVLLLLLSSGIVLHTHLMKNQSWGASGPKFSMDHFSHNIRTNLIFYFDNKAFPLLFTIFGITGLLFYKFRDYIKEKIIILSWLLVFWGIFLFFYAGSYRFGQDVRFSILSYAPISIFVGLGLSSIKILLEKRIKPIALILILLIIFNFTWFMPFVRAEGREAWQARTGHKHAVEFARLLPENSVIFTHTPNIFLLHKKSALQSSIGTYNQGIVERLLERFRGGVFVDYNYWSNVDDPAQRSYTENLLNRYNHELIKEYYRENYKYALYKITGRKD